ncbi:MAG TPA: alanine--tRNA ligase [Chloroflexota bacterium]|jgi:alanyl-tRNA synthetase|nr:alanine--tRNA ligase [Chloroflexota bacterium]
MRGSEIRQQYLDFFRSKGHLVVPSSSLVPQGDPTLLLTNAGMNQMKPYFLGEVAPPSRRMASAQKCFRTTDIDSVGDADHLTFFEMMGNFSVGDYFKAGAIELAWEFSTEWLKVDPERIWVTTYPTDDEARELWRTIVGLPEHKMRLDPTNWWIAGTTGPCGPNTELYFDRGPDKGCGSPECNPLCECPGAPARRFAEYWNLVFMQFNRDEQGRDTPLPMQNVDTGMGLERTTRILGGASTVYEIDLLKPLIERASELTGKGYGEGDEYTDRCLRVIADHSRAVAFLVGDGVLPSNEGRGYILRRVLRRSVVRGRQLGRREPFLPAMAAAVIDMFADQYPELGQRRDFILRSVEIEEGRFHQTLDHGLQALAQVIGSHAVRRGPGQASAIPGEEAFRLYDTYGFPLELTREFAAEKQLEVDEEGFAGALARQREQARASRRAAGIARTTADVYGQLGVRETPFVGYDTLEADTALLGIVRGSELTERADATDGEVELVLRETPFYAEAGGQVGDTGTIHGPAGQAEVLDTQRPVPGLTVHRARVTNGYLAAGDEVRAAVDAERRQDIVRHHSATHLLHKALRTHLGGHVQQAGSLVAPDRLRFDFSHNAPLSAEQRVRIEDEVNAAIRADLPRRVEITSFQEAIRRGAMALFEEKYGEQVRLVSFGDYSRELCGGTHVSSTGQIGHAVVVGEGSVAAGVRRIEVLAGRHADRYVRERLAELERVSSLVHSPDVVGKVQSLLEELEERRREIERLRRERVRGSVDEMLGQAIAVDGMKVLATRVEEAEPSAMRQLGDVLRSKLGPSVVALGSSAGGRATIVVMASPGSKVHAGQVAGRLGEAVGGRGGGRPDNGQAGGPQVEKLDQALKMTVEVVRAQLNGGS